ncbi:MAG: hypothetical protein ACK45E_12855, partial [Ignavibacteria bacterium]
MSSVQYIEDAVGEYHLTGRGAKFALQGFNLCYGIQNHVRMPYTGNADKRSAAVMATIPGSDTTCPAAMLA